MAVYQVDDGWVASSGGRWLPGVFATENAAIYAFQLSDAALDHLNEAAKQGGDYAPITITTLTDHLHSQKRVGKG